MLLGSIPVTIPELVAAIGSGFPFRVPENDRTNLVKAALNKLGCRLGYTVLISEPGRQHDRPTWLLDLVWWEPGRGAVLAVACEWGDTGEIMRSFEKLLATKAPLKLMVFRSRRTGAQKLDILFRTDIEAILQALGTSLIDFSQHIEGETYVLLEHAEEESILRIYEFHVPADAKLAIKFSDAPTLFCPLAAQGMPAA